MNGLLLVLLIALLRKVIANRLADLGRWIVIATPTLRQLWYQGDHRGARSRITVAEVIAKARAEHILPSVYYHRLAPSRKGMAHGAA